MHFKEDTAKPENRVNLTFFHLLMYNKFSDYVKEKIKIDKEAVIYPSPNLVVEEFNTPMRPDFVIIDDNQSIGYIEVELGKENQKQLNDYRNNTNLPVYSIVGKKSYDQGDIALDELYNFLKNELVPKSTQLEKSVDLFKSLIKYYVIDGNFNENKRVTISDKIRRTKIIKELFNYFGEERIIEKGSVERNKIKIDTVGEGGFSIRIYSVNTGTDGLSLMNRTGGRKAIYFPSYKKLARYMPADESFCNEYANLILTLGFKEIFYLEDNKKAKLPLELVEKNTKKFFSIIEKFIQ